MDGSAARRRWLRPDVAMSLLAVGAGLGAALLASQYISQRAAAAEARLAERYAGREVVVASTDVARGSVLSPDNVAVRTIPQDFIPADAVPAARASRLLGATAAIDIARGTPIVPATLVSATASHALSGQLAPQERALTVSVDDLSSQAGGLRVGDRVDLYYSQRSGNGALLVPLLQQVEVLGVGDSFLADAHPGNFGTVTLRVNVADAPRVLLAQQAGELSVLLRNPRDTDAQPVAVRSSSELLRQPVVRRAGNTQIELLIGGGGEQVPMRRLISAGASSRADAS